ncbi:alpha/beta hydrolase [Paraburkholderia nodosa]|uniref:alpha/beta hydrolase n=1 Tax=Paraburkholderia nodosa TaxID=392320 RepID=UPI0004813124|nr:alpha/beta hydrolase [Paraburkholderia nodosa]
MVKSDAPFAPFSALSDDDRRTMYALGPRWADDIVGNRKVVVDTYTPIAATAPKLATVERDVRYGEHSRHTLDIFQPLGLPHGDTLRDAVVFIHGGAFVRGNKSVNGEIYDNVCHWFANQGLVAFNVEYRLADAAPYPGGAEDVADALAFIRGLAVRLRFDARRIVVIGHSAGGAHAAACLFDPALAGRVNTESVAGLVLISARIVADVRPGNPNALPVRAYFGEDETLYAQRSPLTHVARSAVPLMIAIAEYENPYLDEYGAQLFIDALRHRGVPPRFVQMRGHNHTSIVAHFNSGENYLGNEILAFIDDVSPKS